MKRMTDERLAVIEKNRHVYYGIPRHKASSKLSEELLQALKAEREIVARMEQLVDEMQESECGPFPDSPSNEGWVRARRFYSREIQAIIRQAK